MSVDLFLRTPGVLAEFRRYVPFSVPRPEGELLVPPLTRRYALVGQAFDYLLRFHLKRVNPNAVDTGWVADSAARHAMLSEVQKATARRVLAKARAAYAGFLKGGRISDALLTASLQLARLDLVIRIHMFDPGLGQSEDPDDLRDLRALISQAQGVPTFLAKSAVVALNPTFGVPGWPISSNIRKRVESWGVRLDREGFASSLIFGADADLVLDRILVEIKTTKELKVTPKIYFELVSYYILAKIGGIIGLPSHRLERLGIYFSRFGLFVPLPAPALSEPCIEWFVDSAGKAVWMKPLAQSREKGTS